MKYVVLLQARPIFRLLLISLLAALAGCNARSNRAGDGLNAISDPQLTTILDKNIRASGGMAAWEKTQQIQAQVLATVLDRDGGKTILEQTHLLTPTSPLLMTIISQTPEGPWSESLDKNEQVEMVLRGQTKEPQGIFAKWVRYPALLFLSKKKPDERVSDPSVLQGAGLKLRLFSQALAGSFGLLREDWKLTYGGQERKGGRLVYKIVVDGPMLARQNPETASKRGDQLVVWIDAETFLFDRIWLRYRVASTTNADPYVYLAANLKEYQKQTNGLMLPSYIGLVNSDRHQQFSETEILRIETLKFQVSKIKKKKFFQY